MRAITRHGARIGIAGFKLPTDWHRIFNFWHRHRAWSYLSTFEGVYTPWDRLLPYVSDIKFMQKFLSAAVTSRRHGPLVQRWLPNPYRRPRDTISTG